MTSTAPIYRPAVQMMEARAMSAGSVPTPVEAGEQVVNASVSATWQFVPGA
jgi:uncharacterized protein YggE